MKTHNFIYVVAMTLFLSTASFASGNRLGVLGGFNLSKISISDNKFKSTSLTSVGVGLLIEHTLGENLTLCIEPMYLGKGCKFDFTESVEEDDGWFGGDLFDFSGGSFKYTYIEIPVLFKYSMDSGTIKPFLMIGPAVGLLQSARMEINMIEELGLYIDSKEISESIDFGICFGGGVGIPIGSNILFVEGRYTLGLADVYKGGEIVPGEEDSTMPDMEIKNKGIQIMAGLSVPLGE